MVSITAMGVLAKYGKHRLGGVISDGVGSGRGRRCRVGVLVGVAGLNEAESGSNKFH